MTQENNTPEKPATVVQNGVARPSAGTKTARVWEIADNLSSQAGKPAARKDVLEAATKEDINVTTAATQFGRWTKFHGIVKAPAVKKEKAPKAAKASADASVEG